MGEYITFRCEVCKKHSVLLCEEIEDNKEEGRYISCPYCGKSRGIKEIGAYDDLKECSKAMGKKNTYKKVNGISKQIGWENK